MLETEYYWMEKALILAQKALPNDVPVGALILNENGELLAEAYNQREHKQTLSAHAEILALDKACQQINNWRLNNCILYVTLEPCLMCTGAIIQSRLQKVIFGASENKIGSSFELSKAGISVIGGLLEEKCSALLKEFFINQRL